MTRPESIEPEPVEVLCRFPLPARYLCERCGDHAAEPVTDAPWSALCAGCLAIWSSVAAGPPGAWQGH